MRYKVIVVPMTHLINDLLYRFIPEEYAFPFLFNIDEVLDLLVTAVSVGGFFHDSILVDANGEAIVPPDVWDEFCDAGYEGIIALLGDELCEALNHAGDRRQYQIVNMVGDLSYKDARCNLLTMELKIDENLLYTS